MYINTFQCKVDHAGNGNGPLAIMEPLPCGPRRDHRLHTAVRRFFCSRYLSAGHRWRMEDLRRRMGYRRGRDTPAYYAAMHLLTSSGSLYRHTANCFCRYGIEFAYATLREMPPHDYTLFSAAKDIYMDTPGTGEIRPAHPPFSFRGRLCRGPDRPALRGYPHLQARRHH